MARTDVVETGASTKPYGLRGQGHQIVISPRKFLTKGGVKAALQAAMSFSDVNNILDFDTFRAQPGPNAQDRSKP